MRGRSLKRFLWAVIVIIILTVINRLYKPKNVFETSVLEWFQIEKESTDPLLNLHLFAFSLSANVCSRHLDILFFVHSSTTSVELREAARKTWMTLRNSGHVSMATVFMIGMTTNVTIQKSVDSEASVYGDIVQGNFIDDYRNLTYKHIMAYDWILANCPKVKLIIKLDHDVLVNVPYLIKFINQNGYKRDFLYCSVSKAPVVLRNPKVKWYVNESVYPFKAYPNHCAGRAYMISLDAVRQLHKASCNMRFYWIDDIYVTGILALKVGLEPKPFVKGHGYLAPVSLEPYIYELLFIGVGSSRSAHRFWNYIQA
ncbi:beta-1,3-galactosyltransferase 1-like [Haliotis cracherodii]|uniref:beta-1,3-galactosyltransferase 1-like n=1 Tax=Haliotis cracherodii TaxID=6455 RepID=UPI0039EA9186